MSDVYSPKQGIIKTDLAILPEKLLEASEEVVNQVADLILGYAKINVRVDTGSLRDSGRKERGGEGLYWRLMRVRFGGYVTNPKTGKLVDYAAPVEAKYPFLRPALEMAQPEILQLAQSQFAKVLGDAGTVSIEGNEVVVGIRADIGKVTGDFRELEYIAYRTISVLNRMGLPPVIDETINSIQRLILTIRLLHSSIMWFELGTPYGWILATIGGISAFLSFTSALNVNEVYSH